ncbi:MAG: hypothetical protein AAGD06_15470 [Acidobacteriota bacterium]
MEEARIPLPSEAEPLPFHRILGQDDTTALVLQNGQVLVAKLGLDPGRERARKTITWWLTGGGYPGVFLPEEVWVRFLDDVGRIVLHENARIDLEARSDGSVFTLETSTLQEATEIAQEIASRLGSGVTLSTEKATVQEVLKSALFLAGFWILLCGALLQNTLGIWSLAVGAAVATLVCGVWIWHYVEERPVRQIWSVAGTPSGAG